MLCGAERKSCSHLNIDFNSTFFLFNFQAKDPISLRKGFPYWKKMESRAARIWVGLYIMQ
jgi:hypothetical protein